MKTLLYKQLRLVCHPMTPVFCLFGAMLLIPNYPYSVIFFYVTLGLFFTFLNMREQKDIYFSALLPIRKRDTVRAAVVFAVLVEMLSMVITALFCLLSAKLQPGKDNAVGMDANLMLLGAGVRRESGGSSDRDHGVQRRAKGQRKKPAGGGRRAVLSIR